MVKVLKSGFVLVVMIMLCKALFAETEHPKSRVFLKKIPAELTAKIDNKLEGLCKQYPLSKEDAAQVESIVKKFRLEWVKPTASADERSKHFAKQREKIQQFGARAIPTIARMMLSQDGQIRNRSFTPLAFLIKEEGKRTGEDKATDELFVLLFNRCLFDRNPDVRLSAIGGLSWIGRLRFQDMPEGVKTGLEQAEKEDPLLGNRQAAHADRVRLGLTKWDPELLPGGVLIE